ncbi:MAG: hypothetical protein K8963_04480, partial [Proteobacteria bacterium]|nr:hypothetical protein [Pseudomonadota bacterium]
DAITTVTPARTTYAAEGPPATNARNWTLNFGDVTNTDTDPATDENIIVRWQARVIDDDSYQRTPHQASTTRTVPIQVLYRDADNEVLMMNMNVVLDVRQPILSIAADGSNPGITAVPADVSTDAKPNSIVKFTTRVCNVAGGASAHDIVLVSTLPPQFDRSTISIDSIAIYDLANTLLRTLPSTSYRNTTGTDPLDTTERTALFTLTITDAAGLPPASCLLTQLDVKIRENVGIGNKWDFGFNFVSPASYHSLSSSEDGAAFRRIYAVDNKVTFELNTRLLFPASASKVLSTPPRVYATVGEMIGFDLAFPSDDTYTYAMSQITMRATLPAHLERVITDPPLMIIPPITQANPATPATPFIDPGSVAATNLYVIIINELNASEQAMFSYQTRVANVQAAQAGVGSALSTLMAISFASGAREENAVADTIFPRDGDVSDPRALALRSSNLATNSVVVTEPQLSAVRRFYRQDFNGSGILSDLSEISDGTDLDAGD